MNYPRTFYQYGDSPDEFYLLRFFKQLPNGDVYLRMIRFLYHGSHIAIKEKKDVIMNLGNIHSRPPLNKGIEEINSDGTFPPQVQERLKDAGRKVPPITEATLDILFKMPPDTDFQRMS